MRASRGLKWENKTYKLKRSVVAHVGGPAVMKPEGRGFNSHPGQSFPLSLCGPNSISRANAHMVYMGRKLVLSFNLF